MYCMGMSKVIHFIRKYKLYFIAGAVAVILIIGIVLYVRLYRQYAQAQKALQNPTEAAKQRTMAIVDKVGKLILLPAEEPTVANVTDAEKLRGQPFFVNASNGDLALLYQQSKKAVLYRPSTNQIIEVSSISIGPSATESASAATRSAGPETF